jgi:hypothetical protein
MGPGMRGGVPGAVTMPDRETERDYWARTANDALTGYRVWLDGGSVTIWSMASLARYAERIAELLNEEPGEPTAADLAQSRAAAEHIALVRGYTAELE